MAMMIRLVVWGVSPDWQDEHVLDVWDMDSLDNVTGILAAMGWEIGVTNMCGETITKVELRAKA